MVLLKSMSDGSVAFNTGIAKCKRQGGITTLVGWTVQTSKKSQWADCEPLGTVIEVSKEDMRQYDLQRRAACMAVC